MPLIKKKPKAGKTKKKVVKSGTKNPKRRSGKLKAFKTGGSGRSIVSASTSPSSATHVRRVDSSDDDDESKANDVVGPLPADVKGLPCDQVWPVTVVATPKGTYITTFVEAAFEVQSSSNITMSGSANCLFYSLDKEVVLCSFEYDFQLPRVQGNFLETLAGPFPPGLETGDCLATLVACPSGAFPAAVARPTEIPAGCTVRPTPVFPYPVTYEVTKAKMCIPALFQSDAEWQLREVKNIGDTLVLSIAVFPNPDPKFLDDTLLVHSAVGKLLRDGIHGKLQSHHNLSSLTRSSHHPLHRSRSSMVPLTHTRRLNSMLKHWLSSTNAHAKKNHQCGLTIAVHFWKVLGAFLQALGWSGPASLPVGCTVSQEFVLKLLPSYWVADLDLQDAHRRLDPLSDSAFLGNRELCVCWIPFVDTPLPAHVVSSPPLDNNSVAADAAPDYESRDFLSHRGLDLQHLLDEPELRARYIIDFQQKDDAQPNEVVLAQALQSARSIRVVVSANYFTSRWCVGELNYALRVAKLVEESESKSVLSSNGGPVLRVCLFGVSLQWLKEQTHPLAAELAKRNIATRLSSKPSEMRQDLLDWLLDKEM